MSGLEVGSRKGEAGRGKPEGGSWQTLGWKLNLV